MDFLTKTLNVLSCDNNTHFFTQMSFQMYNVMHVLDIFSFPSSIYVSYCGSKMIIIIELIF